MNIDAKAPLRQFRSVASTQYNPAGALKGSNGALTPCASQTDKPLFIYNHMVTDKSVLRPATANLSTAICEMIEGIPCAGNHQIFETDLVGGADAPPINKVAVNSGSTTTALVTAAGSTSDYIGGTLAIPEMGYQGHITGDTVSGGVHTFTVTPAMPRAATTTDHVIAVPFAAISSNAVKLSSVANDLGISCAVADKTGGPARIESVNLLDTRGPVARVSFPYLT